MVEIYITRPQDQALLTSKKLKKRFPQNMSAYITSFSKINMKKTPVPVHFPDSYDAVIFSSINGVKGYVYNQFDNSLPVFTVGTQTAKSAKKYGFKTILNADGNVHDLVNLIREQVDQLANKRLLYATAPSGRPLLEEELSKENLYIERLHIYETEFISTLPEIVRQRLYSKRTKIFLLYSDLTACKFKELINKNMLSHDYREFIILVCLSERIANTVRDMGLRIRVAKYPNENSLFNQVEYVLREVNNVEA